MILTLNQMDSSINNKLQKSKYTVTGSTIPFDSESYVSRYFRECVLYSKWFIKCQNFKLQDYEYISDICAVIFRIQNIRTQNGFGILDYETQKDNQDTSVAICTTDSTICTVFIFSESSYKHKVLSWSASIYLFSKSQEGLHISP
jgi:hypothetical protein